MLSQPIEHFIVTRYKLCVVVEGQSGIETTLKYRMNAPQGEQEEIRIGGERVHAYRYN